MKDKNKKEGNTISRRRNSFLKQYGGKFKVSVKLILLQDVVVDAVKSVERNFNFIGFKIDPDKVLPLARWVFIKIKSKMLLNHNPITVRRYVTKKGGTSSYYQIIDGRHRFTQALIANSTEVTVNLQE